MQYKQSAVVFISDLPAKFTAHKYPKMGRFMKSAKGRLLFMLSLTSSFFLVEIVVGYVTNSMALVADSFHMLSDVIALVIAYVSVRVSATKE